MGYQDDFGLSTGNPLGDILNSLSGPLDRLTKLIRQRHKSLQDGGYRSDIDAIGNALSLVTSRLLKVGSSTGSSTPVAVMRTRIANQQLLCRHTLRFFLSHLVATPASVPVDATIATALKKTAQAIYKLRSDEVQITSSWATNLSNKTSQSNSKKSLSISTSLETPLSEEDNGMDIMLSGCVELLIEQLMTVYGRFQGDLLRELGRSDRQEDTGVDSNTISNVVQSAMSSSSRFMGFNSTNNNSEREDTASVLDQAGDADGGAFLGGFELLDLLEGVTFAAGVLRSVSNSETGRKRLLHTGVVESVSNILKAVEANKPLRGIANLPLYTKPIRRFLLFVIMILSLFLLLLLLF